MNVGSVDFGSVGDTPPIFAQAAGAKIVYVAGQPITNGQGILVKPDSDDPHARRPQGQARRLRQGPSAHNVDDHGAGESRTRLHRHHAGLSESAGRAAAFARGSVDAWAIWDPYFAIGEKKQSGRVLVQRSRSTRPTRSIIANRDFAHTQSAMLRDVIASSAEAARLGGSPSRPGRQSRSPR